MLHRSILFVEKKKQKSITLRLFSFANLQPQPKEVYSFNEITSQISEQQSMMTEIRNMTMEEFDVFAYNELNAIDNIDLIILRGHIIIEYLLNCYLESISQTDNSDFSKEHFSFAHKIKIATHFGPLGSREVNLNRELVLLNKLRNSVAHTLTYDKAQLDDFFAELDKKTHSLNRPSDVKGKLMASIAIICGAIQGAYKL